MPSSIRPERVVIKIGTSSLISAGRPDPAKLTALADAVVRLRAEGRQLVIIASGAIALGRAALNADAARSAAAQQLAAAVGQGLLFDAFRRCLARHGLTAAQIMLTPLDLTTPEHQASSLAVVEGSLDAGLVPVVNENDAVMVRNNDVLAALLAAALRARQLVLLTDVPGLYESDPRRNSGAHRIPEVPVMTPDIERLAGIAAEGLGTGGMPTKLCAAWIATTAGVTTVIVGADTEDCVVRAVRGSDLGTVIHSRVADKHTDLGKLWRALSAPPSGRLLCHPAARRAVNDGEPLLAGHVVGATGRFSAGDVVDVVLDDARVAARGRIRISSVALAEAGAEAMVCHHSEYIAFQEA